MKKLTTDVEQVDDPFCSRIANNNKVIVISLDYPKAPSHPYPAAIEALTDLIKAVLNDATLPFDKKKVAIGGFSAGANLALAVVQNKSVRDKVGGVVAFYPALDFVAKGPEKMKTRPAGGPPDPLEVCF
jgi:acetyl esterase/lipase